MDTESSGSCVLGSHMVPQDSSGICKALSPSNLPSSHFALISPASFGSSAHAEPLLLARDTLINIYLAGFFGDLSNEELSTGDVWAQVLIWSGGPADYLYLGSVCVCIRQGIMHPEGRWNMGHLASTRHDCLHCAAAEPQLLHTMQLLSQYNTTWGNGWSPRLHKPFWSPFPMTMPSLPQHCPCIFGCLETPQVPPCLQESSSPFCKAEYWWNWQEIKLKYIRMV